MMRTAFIAICLLVAMSIPALAQDGAAQGQMIQITTTILDLHDTSLLGSVVVEGEVLLPEIAVLPALRPEEVASLIAAGTVLSEPRVTIREGLPGAVALVEADADADGAIDVGAGIGYIAWIAETGAITLQASFWSYDLRPQAIEDSETALAVLLRLRDGETTALAYVGASGAILNPVYLITAHVIGE